MKLDDTSKKVDLEIQNHLKKLQDIDALFKKAPHLVDSYFNEQEVYKNIEDFKIFLKSELEFYRDSFKLEFDDLHNYHDRINNIANNYHKILYLEEFDTVENRKQERLFAKIKHWVSWYIKDILKN